MSENPEKKTVHRVKHLIEAVKEIESDLDSYVITHQGDKESDLRRWVRYAANNLDDFQRSMRWALAEAEKLENIDA